MAALVGIARVQISWARNPVDYILVQAIFQRKAICYRGRELPENFCDGHFTTLLGFLYFALEGVSHI